MTSDQHPLDATQKLSQQRNSDLALQAAGLGVWEMNPATHQFLWDEQCGQLMGLHQSGYLSFQQAMNFIHPQDRSRVTAAYQWAINPRSEGHFDETYQTLGADEATLRWVHCWGKAHFTPTGEVLRFSGIAQDITAQTLAHQTLQEREQTLRAVVDHMPPTLSLCLLIGPDFIIQAPNQPFIDTLQKGQLIAGKPLREVMPELTEQPFFEVLQHVYRTGQPYQSFGTPARIIQQGIPVEQYFNASYTPLTDAAGQVYGILNTSFNVTQQVLAQQALEQQQAQQRFLLQLSDSLRSLNDPLSVYYQTACLVGQYLGANRVGYAEDQGDGNTIVVLRNYVDGVADLQGTYQYADYGPLLTEFLAGRTVVRSDIAQDPTLTAAQKQAHQLLQLGATLNKPLIKDGRLLAVLFIHYQLAHTWSADELSLLDGVAERLVVAVERTQIEAALRQSEARYRHLSAQLDEQVQQRTGELTRVNQALQRSQAYLHDIFEQAPVAIALLAGPDYRIKLANASLYAIWQLPPDHGSVLDKPVFEAFPGIAGLGLEGLLDEVRQTGLTRQGVEQPAVFSRNGASQTAYINFIYAPIYDEQGNMDVVVVASEVTEQVLARQRVEESQHQYQRLSEQLGVSNAELADANHQLTRSNTNLQTFAYVASHDLQEPLRKIQQFGDLLKSRLGSSVEEEALLYLNRMQSAASRMAILIKDLLEFSRLSTQGRSLGLVPLNAVIDGVLSILDLVIAETGAQVQVGALPSITGDTTQLGQLFQNLISNALKFRRPLVVPQIQIQAHSLPIAAQELPARLKPTRAAEAYYQIDVVDNGVGFEEKYVDRIFQVFQRLHGKSEYGGTGIGLAICERVVSNHGGAITARSQPGQGATFSVYLPA